MLKYINGYKIRGSLVRKWLCLIYGNLSSRLILILMNQNNAGIQINHSIQVTADV